MLGFSARQPQFLLRGAALVGVLALLLAAVGWLWAGTTGVWLALLAVLLEALFIPTASTRTVMRLIGALPVTPWQAPDLHGLVQSLAQRAGLDRMPALYVTPAATIEAMATSDNDGNAIAVSSGALRVLSPREMAGVVAHELSHLAAGDTRLFRLAGAMSGTLRLLALAGLVFTLVATLSGTVVAPWVPLGFFTASVAGTLAEAALWRTREYAADEAAVDLTGDPEGLASALLRIEAEHGPWQRWVRRMRGMAVPEALRTHPPTRARVARLLDGRRPPGHPVPRHSLHMPPRWPF